MTRTLSYVATAFALCGLVSAQSFNIDVGLNTAPGGLAPATLGAAAGQPGTWNAINPAIASPQALADLSGGATPATITRTSGSFASFHFDNPFLSGDDQLLLEDAQDVGFTPSATTWVVNGLLAGTYRTYVYAWAPDNSTFVTSVNGTTVGGAWPGGYVPGVTHAVHDFNVPPGGSISLTLTASTGYGTCNGMQIVLLPPAAIAYCFGDGSGTACPCGNAGTAGNGCASSVNPNGANLAASGIASISADTFVLTGSGMPNSSALYFQGTIRTAGGNGAGFGDGLRCAAGSVLRLGTKTNVGGSSSYPQGANIPISIRGMNSAGGTRDYQCWYRNAALFCNPETFNLTNAVEVVWVQ